MNTPELAQANLERLMKQPKTTSAPNLPQALTQETVRQTRLKLFDKSNPPTTGTASNTMHANPNPGTP